MGARGLVANDRLVLRPVGCLGKRARSRGEEAQDHPVLTDKARSDSVGTSVAVVVCTAVALTAGIATTSRADDGQWPAVAIHYVELPAADLPSADADAQVRTREYRGSFGLATLDVGQITLDLLADYQYTRFLYDEVSGRDRDLHRLQFPLVLRAPAGGIDVSGYLAPGIAASSNVTRDFLDEAGGDDYFVTARIDARFERNSETDWIAGLAFDRAFGRIGLYPIIGVESQLSERTALRLTFPDSKLSFRPNARHELSLRLYPAGSEWHVVSEESDRDFDYRTEGWRVQGTWTIDGFDQLRMDVSLGWAFRRHHDFFDDRGQRIRTDVDDALLISIGLRLGDAPIPYGNEVAYE